MKRGSYSELCNGKGKWEHGLYRVVTGARLRLVGVQVDRLRSLIWGAPMPLYKLVRQEKVVLVLISKCCVLMCLVNASTPHEQLNEHAKPEAS